MTKATTGTGRGVRSDSWAGLAIQTLVVVVSTWQLFAQEIHGYIDTKMNETKAEVIRDVSAIGHGQMLIVKDSTLKVMRQFQDSTNTRLDMIEEQTQQPNVNRTVIHAADTGGMHQLNDRMRLLEEGIEHVLDGIDNVPWKRRPAHNERHN